MQFRAAAAILLTLAVPGADWTASRASAAAYQQSGGEWTIGPFVRGRNRSRGMPLHPTPGPRGSFYIDLPQAPGSAHYVTFPHGSLAGKRRIVMRYRVVTAPGVTIVPRSNPALPSMITLYFQRAGDNWSARGPFETFRWYATFATHSPITPGDHIMVAPLNANWTAVMTSSARTQPAAFREALAEADQVGFVLGGGDGYGHGVYATGPARLIVTSFRVE
ncbi:MAG TPA: hypothetical protein VF631_14425 [Allosphingosinicella sp.]|jgi:hypothetical protein|uniref:hypothetical protein n=1 Tax=Allosphingosinicella sp. TaxID=2823234 RepID=UPI002F271BAB